MKLSEEIDAFLDAIGAIAEMELSHYRALIINGATPEEAAAITTAFVRAMIRKN